MIAKATMKVTKMTICAGMDWVGRIPARVSMRKKAVVSAWVAARRAQM